MNTKPCPSCAKPISADPFGGAAEKCPHCGYVTWNKRFKDLFSFGSLAAMLVLWLIWKCARAAPPS